MLIIAPGILLQDSAHITLYTGDNPASFWCCSGIGATLSNGTYHFQICTKLRECVKLAHKKAKSIQAKEAQHHKLNYDKHSRAAALETGDMVLVCVTAFKGHHKIQDEWDNREYVVERWSYPNVPVYVVHLKASKQLASLWRKAAYHNKCSPWKEKMEIIHKGYVILNRAMKQLKIEREVNTRK